MQLKYSVTEIIKHDANSAYIREIPGTFIFLFIRYKRMIRNGLQIICNKGLILQISNRKLNERFNKIHQ